MEWFDQAYANLKRYIFGKCDHRPQTFILMPVGGLVCDHIVVKLGY
jgi:hypothetical protein